MPNPTIVAIGGGGLGRDPYDPRLDDYLLSLTGKSTPRVAFLPQASAENKDYVVRFYEKYGSRSQATYISLFNRTIKDLRSVLLAQDMIYVGGGNTANMLAIWRVHGVADILQEAWAQGIVLCGVSAGSICWFESSVTDSFGPQLAPLHDGLALLPGSNCPHYDGEVLRRPVYQELISERILPAGYAADDGVALTFRGTELHEIVSIYPNARAWRLEPGDDRDYKEKGLPGFVETELRPRMLE